MLRVVFFDHASKQYLILTERNEDRVVLIDGEKAGHGTHDLYLGSGHQPQDGIE